MSDVEPRIMMEVLLGYLLFILAVILALVFNRVWVMYFATMLVTIMFLRNMKDPANYKIGITEHGKIYNCNKGACEKACHCEDQVDCTDEKSA